MTDITLAQAELPVSVTETSWTPERELTFDEWERAGQTLLRVGRAWQWWVGDWILYGEHAYGEKYAQAIDLTGFEYDTLRNVVSVARRVATSLRRDNLTWSHHVVVAALDPAGQDEWLGRADEEGMTVARLRSRVSEATGASPPTADDDLDLRPTFRCELQLQVGADSYDDAVVTVARIAERLERPGVHVAYKTVRP